MEHYIYVMDYSVGTIVFFTISNPDDVESELKPADENMRS